MEPAEHAELIKAMRDALEEAAGNFVPPNDEQRNAWYELIQQADEVLEPNGV